MKETTLAKILAVACSLAVVTAMAQTSTTVTTKDAAAGTAVTETSATTSTGTISTYTPGTDYITFRTSTDTAPVRYYYSKDTTILDPEGRTVTWSAVRPDLPASGNFAAGIDYFAHARAAARAKFKKITFR